MAALAASPLEIVTTRTFPASRDQVFQAWTDPERLARWWGPKDFTNTFREFDLHPGGRWQLVMHGPDGTDYENLWVFEAIQPPAGLVIDHQSNPKFQITATFEPEGGATRVTFRMRFETVALREAISKVVVPSNEEMFDRLGAELSR